MALEKKYPALITVAIAGSSGGAGATSAANEIILARAHLAGLETHAKELQSRFAALGQRLRTLNDIAPRITELERKKDVQETSYRYYGAP